MDNQDTQPTLSAIIESILFFTAEPMSYKKLALLTKTSIDDIKIAIDELNNRLTNTGSGICVLFQNNEVALGTNSKASSIIEQITRDEISKELSKASLETLSIICYKGPLTRSDIDYIRGVNSTFILRNLLIRGIIEKLDNPRDARASLYGATFAALEYMGVTRIQDLPQYDEVQAQMAAFLAEKSADDSLERPKENQDEIPESKSEDDNIDDFGDNLDADINEENLMSPSFDDSEIKEHTNSDEQEEVSQSI